MPAPRSLRTLARWLRLWPLPLSMLLVSCTLMQGQLDISYRNRPDPGTEPVRPTTPVPRAAREWLADKDTFVGVAISGGGSRSANFGMAALTELQQLGVLPHVDAISAVSGGSIPAAFFALNGDRPDWSQRGREAAAIGLVWPLLAKLANPVNALRTTFTDRDRTDALAELFDARLLGGQMVTFGELGARGPMRPAVYFNATETTGGGRRFVFNDADFLERAGSDLSRYPLAWAMASSGAFPGIFNSVTLRRYSTVPERREAERSLLADARFLHLIDGGGSDNLGVETLMELARQHHVQRRRPGRDGSRGCLIIVIDSHVPSLAVAESTQSDRRNVASMLFDLNFLDAIDAMLTGRRAQSLLQMGIRRDQPRWRYDVALGGGLKDYDVTPYRRVGRFEVPFYAVGNVPVADPASVIHTNRPDFTQTALPPVNTFTCHSWHIALDEVNAIVPTREREGRLQPLSFADPQDQEVFADRSRLARVISQVATSYQLSGPTGCTAEQVQDAIYAAARIAVRQDAEATGETCRWFSDRGLDTGGRCRADPAPLTLPELKIEPVEAPNNLTRPEQAARRLVQCK